MLKLRPMCNLWKFGNSKGQLVEAIDYSDKWVFTLVAIGYLFWYPGQMNPWLNYPLGKWVWGVWLPQRYILLLRDSGPLNFEYLCELMVDIPNDLKQTYDIIIIFWDILVLLTSIFYLSFECFYECCLF